MNTSVLKAIAVGAVLAASATDAVVLDPMYCQAQRLHKESNYYSCLARCERKETASERFNVERCESRCETGMTAAFARIDRKRRCASETPDPNLCEARVLDVEARGMTCRSLCDRKTRRRAQFDSATCSSACDGTAEQTLTVVLDSPICGLGRVVGSAQ